MSDLRQESFLLWKTKQDEMVGVAETFKIFDWLFLSDCVDLDESDFFKNNTISLWVHCPSRQGPVPHSGKTFTFEWVKPNGQIIDQILLRKVQELAECIEGAREKCESVLVISKHIWKCLSLCAVYCMARFGLSLQECLEIMKDRVRGHCLKATHLRRLRHFEDKLKKSKAFECYKCGETEAQVRLIRNTLQNGKIKNMVDFHGLSLRNNEEPQYELPVKVKFSEKIESLIRFTQNKSFEEEDILRQTTPKPPQRKKSIYVRLPSKSLKVNLERAVHRSRCASGPSEIKTSQDQPYKYCNNYFIEPREDNSLRLAHALLKESCEGELGKRKERRSFNKRRRVVSKCLTQHNAEERLTMECLKGQSMKKDGLYSNTAWGASKLVILQKHSNIDLCDILEKEGKGLGQLEASAGIRNSRSLIGGRFRGYIQEVKEKTLEHKFRVRGDQE